MKTNTIIYSLFLVIMLINSGYAQSQSGKSFTVIPLGVKGGLDESNLSSYLITNAGSQDFICADAGTLRHGIDVAISRKALSGTTDEVLKNHVKGYLISHGHLDHVAGLIINSPEDSPKNIYAFPSVIDVLKDKYFTWKSWANFTNEGDAPHLNKYTYVYLKEKETIDLKGTAMTVKAFPLSHGPAYESTAFLIGHSGDYLLYLGDTGSDQVEKSDRLQQLWQQIAPLIQKNELKAIFIETSFPNAQPEKQLFGHLTPHLLMAEMDKLCQLTGLVPLQKVSIVITHMKSFGKHELELVDEIKNDNPNHLKLVVPVQGKEISF